MGSSVRIRMIKNQIYLSLVVLAVFLPIVGQAATMSSQSYIIDSGRVGDVQILSGPTNSENYTVAPTGNTGVNSNTSPSTNTALNTNIATNNNSNESAIANTNFGLNANTQPDTSNQSSPTSPSKGSLTQVTSWGWKIWTGIGVGLAAMVTAVIVLLKSKRKKQL